MTHGLARRCDNVRVKWLGLPVLVAISAAGLAQQPIGSKVFDWTKLVAAKTANGERRGIVDGPTTTMAKFESHVTTLEGGRAPHAPHRHPDEEIVIVKDGAIEVTVNGQTQQAGAGSMFFFASNDLHGMKNIGTARATYFVIRITTAATPAAVKKE